MPPRRLFLGAIAALLLPLVLPGGALAAGEPTGPLTGCPAIDAPTRILAVAVERQVTLTPPSGAAGSEVSVNVFNFPPKLGVAVILRVTGDPVVATGTTDDDGRGNFVFTVPGSLAKGTYNIHVTSKDVPCFGGSGARFTVTDPTPTPTPATPTPTPTSTPIVTQTPPPTATTTTPLATSTTPPTPRPPVAGLGLADEDDGSGGPAVPTSVIVIVFGVLAAGFVAMAAAQRRPAVTGMDASEVYGMPEDDAQLAPAAPKRATAAEATLFTAGVAVVVAGLALLIRGKKG